MAKYRLGFVSNSSSSSFVCDVCGYEASGCDMCLSESDMFECENGHTCCNEHLLTENATPEFCKKMYDKLIEEEKKYDINAEDDILKYCEEKDIDINNLTFDDIDKLYNKFCEGLSYNIPEELCPLCNFEELDMIDAQSYLLKTTKYTIEEVFQYIKSVNCRRKKVRSHEYVEYVCDKLGITTTELLKQIDDRFNGSYSEFSNFLMS